MKTITEIDLEDHKKKMLKFCKDRNLAIDDIIARIERFIDSGEYDKPGKGEQRPTARKCARLLIEALDAIKKLTGK